jgi:glycosyltransferase involved in cell wall biosynthesis
LTFSIIIPAYNAEKYIAQTVNSILNQTHGDFEILIADDGSKDGTRMIIDRMTDTRINRYHNNQNLGYLKTCNKLMALAKGDFIVFQDADDLSLPTRLEEQYRFITENGLDACGTWVQRIDSHGNNTTLEKYPINIIEGLAEGKFNFVGGTFMVKREVVKKIGTYHEYFNRIGFEDYYWTVLIAFNYKILNIQKALYCYRQNNDSVSSNFSNFTRDFSFRSVLVLLKQKIAGERDYLETKNSKMLKQEVFEQMIANFSSKNKRYKRQALFKCLLNQPFYLKNYKILIRNIA